MKALIAAVLSLLLLLAGGARLQAEEPDDSRIIERILQSKQEILKALAATNSAAPVTFLAVWDFDGTVLKSDCSEGLRSAGQLVYEGLAQRAIASGLSSLYPSAGGFERFWTDYTNLDTRVGHWLAYPFIPQMLRGAKAEDVLHLSQAYFTGTLSNYLMASSVKIMRALARGGVESQVISASADLFVKGASQSLGLPAEHLHGIEVRARKGRLTEEIVYPVTWNVGKRDKLQQIVAQLEAARPGRHVLVLAGFGDSYNTDGPFLKYIATQRLPAGKPLAVFYDGQTEPEEYRGLFYQARHRATVSERANP